MSVLLLGLTFVSCNDDFDTPPMVVPQATHQPNMTIADFKAKYWKDVNNYIDTVKEDIVIHGWVTANDVSGNIYKSLYISDGTAGFSISINGPNLNLLGVRETGIYGSDSFDSFLPKLRAQFPDAEIDYYQSNIEGELIDKMQEVGFSYDGIVLNAGAYTHTSVALHDCIRAIKSPVIEVHISNVHQREEFRHHSFISAACKGVICGFGLNSYTLAVEAITSQKD